MTYTVKTFNEDGTVETHTLTPPFPGARIILTDDPALPLGWSEPEYRVGDPDPTPDGPGVVCGAVDPRSMTFECTWHDGHEGPHVAGDYFDILAVWV